MEGCNDPLIATQERIYAFRINLEVEEDEEKERKEAEKGAGEREETCQ